MKTFNEFCKAMNCPEYIEWEFDVNGDSPYICSSCQIVGQSYDVEEYPKNCLFINEIKLFEKDYEKWKTWQKVSFNEKN